MSYQPAESAIGFNYYALRPTPRDNSFKYRLKALILHAYLFKPQPFMYVPHRHGDITVTVKSLYFNGESVEYEVHERTWLSGQTLRDPLTGVRTTLNDYIDADLRVDASYFARQGLELPLYLYGDEPRRVRVVDTVNDRNSYYEEVPAAIQAHFLNRDYIITLIEELEHGTIAK